MALTVDSNGIEYAVELAQGNSKIKPNQLEGRVRIGRFSYTIPTGDEAIASNVALVRLPKGARIIEGKIKGEAMGNSSTVDIGLMGADGSGFINADGDVADDVDFFLDGGDVNAAFNLDFAATIALNYGYELEKNCILLATPVVGAWDAGQDLVGHVKYVVD